MDKGELIRELWNLREKLRGTVGIMDEDLNVIRDAMTALDPDYLKYIP